jgi:hypothetical protein
VSVRKSHGTEQQEILKWWDSNSQGVRSQGTGRATVTAFDLRPIGFAVHGSATGGIDVGNSKLSGNTFANAMSAISFS